MILLVEPDPMPVAAGAGDRSAAVGRRFGRRGGGDVGHELPNRDQLLSPVRADE